MIYNLYMCRHMVCGPPFEVLLYFPDLASETYSPVGARDGGMEPDLLVYHVGVLLDWPG